VRLAVGYQIFAHGSVAPSKKAPSAPLVEKANGIYRLLVAILSREPAAR
jgi:hypothetical protein